ncbi:GntR family transcriptional regulator [Siminovitchia terrae]|uniref:GntR family transcriptional regulator n=1 Tax=Siminovitchia terrae TaxID=1914933 RepID=A0ABQ4L1E2_SIMTE|nr:GntR family transcriptional regulator [Siminovitchia terrae]GIN97739.1 GntR family transcriptional regulator [Siminovitchia terrae]
MYPLIGYNGVLLVENKPLTLEEEIYENIKHAIFSKKIGPKMMLSEEQLAEAFNVSRTPIRHVLKRMQYEKIVEIKPKKGAFIHEPSKKEIEEVFHVKLILEKEATKMAYQNISEQQLDELEALTYKEEEYFQRGEYYQALLTANKFHADIIQACGNNLLIQYYNDLTDLTNLYLALYDNVPENPPGPSEHRRIINALRSKNEEEIDRELVSHWIRVKDYMVYNKEKDLSVDLKTIFNPLK